MGRKKQVVPTAEGSDAESDFEGANAGEEDSGAALLDIKPPILARRESDEELSNKGDQHARGGSEVVYSQVHALFIQYHASKAAGYDNACHLLNSALSVLWPFCLQRFSQALALHTVA